MFLPRLVGLSTVLFNHLWTNSCETFGRGWPWDGKQPVSVWIDLDANPGIFFNFLMSWKLCSGINCCDKSHQWGACFAVQKVTVGNADMRLLLTGVHGQHQLRFVLWMYCNITVVTSTKEVVCLSVCLSVCMFSVCLWTGVCKKFSSNFYEIL